MHCVRVKRAATEAAYGRAVEMDLQYGDNEERFAAAISICVVDSGYDPGADPTSTKSNSARYRWAAYWHKWG